MLLEYRVLYHDMVCSHIRYMSTNLALKLQHEADCGDPDSFVSGGPMSDCSPREQSDLVCNAHGHIYTCMQQSADFFKNELYNNKKKKHFQKQKLLKTQIIDLRIDILGAKCLHIQ